jgi:hypothetical protein
LRVLGEDSTMALIKNFVVDDAIYETAVTNNRLHITFRSI